MHIIRNAPFERDNLGKWGGGEILTYGQKGTLSKIG